MRVRQPLCQETETPGESLGIAAASCELSTCSVDTTTRGGLKDRPQRNNSTAGAEPLPVATAVPEVVEYVIDSSGTSYAKHSLTLAQMKEEQPLYPNRAITHYNQIKTNQTPDTYTGLPECFYCPITQDTMKDPVVLPDGYSFERLDVEEWVALHGTSPITRQQVSQGQIRPNKALREAIEIEMSVDSFVQFRQSRWSRCTSFGSFVFRQSRWSQGKALHPF